ncbi:hypothetical protein COLO4_23538 [Corchorus olitorius]|uniref:Uncharacterized protein n=1 Tax=Corchorus olitorius TaxID=93759 RepID=A0A1R3IG12_9ROSI|nr:hypothetical protein COLO4_23538 [Corchorus olitorius]
MARPIFVLALIMIALVGLVAAADNAAKPKDAAAAAAPVAEDDDIGTIGGDAEAGAPAAGDAVEGPIGSVAEALKHAVAAPGPSGAPTLGTASAVVGATAAAAVAGYFVL